MADEPVPQPFRWLWATVGAMPSTNVRISTTIALAVGTALTYWASGLLGKDWTPSVEWLGFLAVSYGIDSAQFIGKRTTDAAYVAAKASPPIVDTPPKQEPGA